MDTTVWRGAFSLGLLCFILNCVDPCCSSRSDIQRAKDYNTSLSLTRFTRSRVQQLLLRYNEQHLGDKHFEDRNLQLEALPVLSTDLYMWLNLKDWERLHSASRDLRAYWEVLEQKRLQLEREDRQLRTSQRGGNRSSEPTITKGIQDIELNLMDLMGQVNSQLKHMNSSRMSHMFPMMANASSGRSPSRQPPSQTLWDSRREGYVILRDLNLYLTKIARDFLLLASKHRNTHNSKHRTNWKLGSMHTGESSPFI